MLLSTQHNVAAFIAILALLMLLSKQQTAAALIAIAAL